MTTLTIKSFFHELPVSEPGKRDKDKHFLFVTKFSKNKILYIYNSLTMKRFF